MKNLSHFLYADVNIQTAGMCKTPSKLRMKKRAKNYTKLEILRKALEEIHSFKKTKLLIRACLLAIIENLSIHFSPNEPH
jgi:hypothetical protein